MCVDSIDILNALEEEAPPSPFSIDDAQEFNAKVYYGAITTESLDVAMYAQTVGYLMGAVLNGFGGLEDSFVIGTGWNLAAKGLENNIWRFSAAKQYQQVRILSRLVNAGTKFEDFTPVANLIFSDYNINYLKTEYVTALLQSQAAREWVDFQENDEIEYLRYNTQRDARVRPRHKELDGVVLPKNHAFWNDYNPANGWRCRCFVTGQKTASKVTDLSKKKIPEFGSPDFPKEFKMNPGKDRIIFNKNHPYYSVAKGDLNLKKNNFNLPLP